MLWQVNARGAKDRHKQQVFSITAITSGGTGARPTKDGLSATAFPSGVRGTPVEINESVAPLIFWRKEFRTDSGGAGKRRGTGGGVFAHSGEESGASAHERHSVPG